MILEPGARVWAFNPPKPSFPNGPGSWQEITVGKGFGDGGTANVYVKDPHPHSRTLIKVYHLDLGKEDREGFHARIYRLTQFNLKLRSRIPIVAWPEAILFKEKRDSPETLIGCTMPLIDDACPLTDLAVDLESLKDYLPGATQESLRLIALNIIEGFELLHSREVLFGDPNANNILVNKATFDVSFIDADSYSVTIIPPNGTDNVFFPPPATARGFRSPRTAILAGPNNNRLTDYGEGDDNYALAVHLFMLLVPGFHPWGGVTEAAERASISRRFPYAGPSKSLSNASHQMQLFLALPAAMQAGFTRAFAETRPPTAAEWRDLFKAHWGHLRGQLERRDFDRPPPRPKKP